MYEMVVIGAGPAGISMASEAVLNGVSSDKILIIEKGDQHSFSIRKFYPDSKTVAATYKGKAAICNGVMCITDMSKGETLSYLDQIIEQNNLIVNYNESVNSITKKDDYFEIITDKQTYNTKVCTIAIGIMGRPNKPDYKIPSSIKENVHFDITSTQIENKDVLVVGGGDSASEYVQYLVQSGNKVTICYRREEFTRMTSLNRESLNMLKSQNKIKMILNMGFRQ